MLSDSFPNEHDDLLPKRYEFPSEKLKLGKLLGEGAFGIVVKGTAQNILRYEGETMVAVKMLKERADKDVSNKTKFSFN